jgi:hypothetical protein
MKLGDVFGRLKIIEFLPKSKVFVQCSCGNNKIVRKGHLKDGNTNSCGCLRKELQSAKMKTHGMEGTPTYKSWNNMMMRCTNPKRSNYEEYGGSGVTVSDSWYKFENFYEDMGERPHGMTLNRIGGAKIYSKETCEWATLSTQSYDQKKRYTNTSGKTGVSFQESTGKWKVEITKEKKIYFIGYFVDFEKACAARDAAEIKHYGRNLE